MNTLLPIDRMARVVSAIVGYVVDIEGSTGGVEGDYRFGWWEGGYTTHQFMMVPARYAQLSLDEFESNVRVLFRDHKIRVGKTTRDNDFMFVFPEGPKWVDEMTRDDLIRVISWLRSRK
jgi:hypothetical protein